MIVRRKAGQPLGELEIIQNPALGAYCIWQFALGYQQEDGLPPSLLLAFLVLPLLLHRETVDAITTTRKGSGLALFASKMAIDREKLLAIHERARLLRELTMTSVAVGIESRLLTVIYKEGTVRGNSVEELTKKPVLPERLKPLTGAADKLGYWFSKVGPHQVASTLCVGF